MVRANIFKCTIVAQYLSVDDAALCLSCFCRCAKICEANICGIKLQGMDGGGGGGGGASRIAVGSLGHRGRSNTRNAPYRILKLSE